MQNKILIEGNWYEPLHYLQSQKNVTDASLLNTSSSAGDWDGYFIKKYKKYYTITQFSQENNWPNGGFNLYIGQYEKLDHKPTEDEIAQWYEMLCY